MKITWDKKADATYIYLKKGKIAYTKKRSEWLLTDHAKNGDVLGIEILEASRNIFRKIRLSKKIATLSTN